PGNITPGFNGTGTGRSGMSAAPGGLPSGVPLARHGIIRGGEGPPFDPYRPPVYLGGLHGLGTGGGAAPSGSAPAGAGRMIAQALVGGSGGAPGPGNGSSTGPGGVSGGSGNARGPGGPTGSVTFFPLSDRSGVGPTGGSPGGAPGPPQTPR